MFFHFPGPDNLKNGDNSKSSGGALTKEKIFLKIAEKHLCRILFFDKVAGCKPETVRSSPSRFSVKQGVRKNFASFTEKKTFVGVSF